MCQAIQIIKIISFLSLLLISGIAKAVIISTEYNGEEKSKLLAESKAAEAICSLEVIYRLKTVRGTCVYIDLGQGSASSKSVGIILTSAHLLDVAGEAPIVIQVKFSSSSEMNTIDEFSIHPLHQVIERKGHIAILKMEVPENFGIQGMKLGFSSDDLQKESLLMGSFGGRIALNLPNQEWIEKLEKRVVHVYPTLILKKNRDIDHFGALLNLTSSVMRDEPWTFSIPEEAVLSKHVTGSLTPGDSGGPLFYWDKSIQQSRLVGVAEFGTYDDSSPTMTLHWTALTSSTMKWIQSYDKRKFEFGPTFFRYINNLKTLEPAYVNQAKDPMIDILLDEDVANAQEELLKSNAFKSFLEHHSFLHRNKIEEYSKHNLVLP